MVSQCFLILPQVWALVQHFIYRNCSTLHPLSTTLYLHFINFLPQTDRWIESFFGIESSEVFVLEIWGTQGDNLLANLAVDDIKMSPGLCPGKNIQYIHPSIHLYLQSQVSSAELPSKGGLAEAQFQFSLLWHSLSAHSIPCLPTLYSASTLMISVALGLPLTPPPPILPSYALSTKSSLI